METKLQKWGNSYGVRIPSPLLKELDLKANDRLELIQDEDKIIMFKSNKQNISLKERFEEYNDKHDFESYDFGNQKGREIW